MTSHEEPGILTIDHLEKTIELVFPVLYYQLSKHIHQGHVYLIKEDPDGIYYETRTKDNRMKKHYRGKRHTYARRNVAIGRDRRRIKKAKRILPGLLKTIRFISPAFVNFSFISVIRSLTEQAADYERQKMSIICPKCQVPLMDHHHTCVISRGVRGSRDE